MDRKREREAENRLARKNEITEQVKEIRVLTLLDATVVIGES